MAHLHNFHNRQRPSFVPDIGNKIKTIAEVGGAAKTIYDLGKMAYTGIRALGPMISTAGLIL